MIRLLARLRPAVMAWVLLLAVSPLRAAPQDATAPPPDEVAGETFTVHGVTETVDEIMARDARLPHGALPVWEKPEPRRRRDKQPNPDALPLAQWPPPEGEDGVPALLRPPGRLPQTVGVDFHAIQLSESGFVPPDSMGAVGPSQVLVATNGRIKVFDKTGVLGPLNTTMDNFFAPVGGLTNGTTDPHVRYDRLSQRWFVVIIDIGSPTCPNNVLMAVSSGPTITGTSSFTFFSFVGQIDRFADYPTLGVDANALYIGANMFDDPAVGCAAPFLPFQTTVWVVNKAAMIAGAPTITAFRNLVGASTGILTPQGVDNDDPAASAGYFVGVDFYAFSKLILKRVNAPGAAPTLSADISLTVPVTVFPQAQPQPVPGPALDALDDRLFAAAIHADKVTGASTLWTAHNIEVDAGCVGNVNGSRNGSRWYQIGDLAGAPSLIQSGTLCDPAATTPFGYWIPSVAMTGQGHMSLAASRAGTAAGTGFASIASAGRLRTDALGTTQAPTLVLQSTSLYDTGLPGTERWGDYSQTVVDPNDDQTLWTFQEYANATNSWGVRVTQLRAPPPATPSAANPATVAQGQASVNVTITGTSSAGSEFFDPGADPGGPGFPSRIAGDVSGGVTVNSVTFDSPTQVTLNISTVGTPAGAKDVTVTNPDGQSRTGTGLLTVTGGCPTITVNPPGLPDGTAGTPYSQTFTQTGGTGTITWSLTGTLPAGLSFDTTTGVLSGTPTQTGSFSITVKATDANGCVGSNSYTFGIACPIITVNPATIPDGTAGTAYSQTFTQTGGIGTITWALTGLPAGLSFSTTTGVLSGTPTQTGSFPITVTATDANGCIGTRSYTLVINCQAITVNPATIPAGTAGTAYSQTFTQTGGIGTITWALTGTLPTGLSFNTTTGVLSGTPTQTGSFPITITATDANGCIGTRSYTLVINCQAITVDPATIPNGTAGTAYSQTFTQTGGIGTITWALTGTLPAGLSFSTTTGVLSGTPTQTGSFPITVTATDANGCIGSRPYTLVINCQTISVNPPTIPAGTAGTAYSQTFTQTGGIGTITWALTGTLPTGLSFNTATGVLSGTPTQTGSFPITVTATDANGCIGSRPYTLVIQRAGPFVPTALSVDAGANGIFEPGETVVVAPSWRNDTGAPEAVTGAATGFIGPAGATYTIADAGAGYGLVAPGATASCSAGGDCYGLGVSAPSPRPALHWDGTFVETLSSTDAKTWTLHIGATFTDVPVTNAFYRFIEATVHKNVTGGCTATEYCPGNSTTREQMAVFVLVSREAAGYAPPACGAAPMFPDVPVASPFCRWVEELARRGVVGGCGGGNYCPAQAATREQMAVFVLRTLDPALSPPACVAGAELFADVPAASGFCRWIEELARRGVVTGCGGGNYCPTAPVSREQMAVFLAVTFGLALYGV